MLFERALSAKEKQEIADNFEVLNLELNDYIISKSKNGNFDYKVGEYIDYAVNDNVFSDKDVSDEQETSAYVKMAKKYIYFVEKESNGNIKITYNRKISGNSVDLTDAVLAMDMEWVYVEGKGNLEWTSEFPLENSPTELGELVTNGTYGFKVDGTTLIPENKGIHSTTAEAYMPLDLTEYNSTQKYTLTINATISSESNYDYGWVSVTDSSDATSFNSSSSITTTGNIIKTLFIKSGTVAANDYTCTLDGGKTYYIHFGYRKDGSSNSGLDAMIVNSIGLSGNLTGRIKTPKITLSTETQGVDLQYMVENQNGQIVTDWTDGEEVLKISDNGTERYLTYGDTIYGRIVSGENTSAISQINIQDGVAPVIEITATNTYSDEITVTVDNVKDNCGMPETVLFDYYIAEDGSDYKEEPENSKPTEFTSYTFTGLIQRKTYKIKVVTHDLWNNEGFAETTKTTVAVPQGASIKVSWDKGEPSVYIDRSSSYSHYKIQYQVNSTSSDGWNEINSGEDLTEVEYGDTVYARLIDDVGNASNYSSVTIVDNSSPNLSIEYFGSSSEGINGYFEYKYDQYGNYSAQEGDYLLFYINQNDDQSGVDISNCRWMLTTDSYCYGKEYMLNNGETFTSNEETIYPSVSSTGTYYLHVLTVDWLGNDYEEIWYLIEITSPSSSGEGEGEGGDAELVEVAGEEFYIIDSDEETYTLLAARNINVNTLEQSNDAQTIAFCSDNAYNSLGGFTSGENLNENATIQSESTSAVSYARAYAEKIRNQIGWEVTGRLMKVEEVEALGGRYTSTSNCPSYINSYGGNKLLYWLGSAFGSVNVWGVIGEYDVLDSDGYYSDNDFGVRPVIIISKSYVNPSSPGGDAESVEVSGEEFYIIDSDEETYTLLAARNINVNTLEQSNDAQTIAFCSDDAFINSLGSFISGENLNENETIQSDSTSAVSYARAYAEKISSQIGWEVTGRLMTVEEVEALGGSRENESTLNCPSYINSYEGNYLMYWLGSADYEDRVCYVDGEYGFLGNLDYAYDNFFGVRPVIIISKSYFNP